MRGFNEKRALSDRLTRIDEAKSPDIAIDYAEINNVQDPDLEAIISNEDALKSFMKTRLKRHSAAPELLASIRQQIKGDYHFPR